MKLVEGLPRKYFVLGKSEIYGDGGILCDSLEEAKARYDGESDNLYILIHPEEQE